MGIDTDVLLRIRDRKALRNALQAHAARKRKEWADQGREAEYEELLRDGYDPTPLIRPLDDGSALIFTGLRFHDEDMEFAIRFWLDEHFGSALGAIHDDPRGVFVSPDICEPKARTYDGVIEELAKAGRFINPAPPTAEEREQRAHAFEELSAGMDAVRAASASGDPAALEAALAAAPASVRRSWEAQTSVPSRLPLVPISFGVEEPEAQPVDASVARRGLELMGISTRAEDGPVDSAKIGAMLESFLSARRVGARSGSGRGEAARRRVPQDGMGLGIAFGSAAPGVGSTAGALPRRLALVLASRSAPKSIASCSGGIPASSAFAMSALTARIQALRALTLATALDSVAARRSCARSSSSSPRRSPSAIRSLTKEASVVFLSTTIDASSFVTSGARPRRDASSAAAPASLR